MSTIRKKKPMPGMKDGTVSGEDENAKPLPDANQEAVSHKLAVDDWVKSEEEWVSLTKQPDSNWRDHQFPTQVGHANAHTMKVLRDLHLGKQECQLDSLLKKRPRLDKGKCVTEKADLVHYPTVHHLQYLQSYEVLVPEQVPSEWVLGGGSNIKEEMDVTSS